MKWFLSLLFLAAACYLPGCTQVENQQPISDFEKTKGPLPAFDLKLDSTGGRTIRFDSIAQGGNFSLAFKPLTFGKVVITESGRAVSIEMIGKNWKRDSTEYTICKNGVCRTGEIKMINLQYKKPDTIIIINPTDTACSELPLRTIYLNFDASLDIRNLFPSNGKGQIDSLKTQIYTVQNIGDTLIRYQSSNIDVDQKWAFDTIHYQLKQDNRKCWTGKIAVVLGDTLCQPQARNDVIQAPSGSFLIKEDVLVVNDKDCHNQLPDFQTRTPYEAPNTFDYGQAKTMFTKYGILQDTGVAFPSPSPGQYYKYTRTNPLATEDGFYYYFKDLSTGRVTKAWVRILFN